MTFANPQAFWFLLLALPLAALYFRRPPLPQATVATGFIWHEVLAKHRRRLAWRRWRTAASATVQMAILVLLVSAMAGPRWPWPAYLAAAALLLLAIEWPLYWRRWLV